MREKSLKSYVSTELFEVSQRKPPNLLDGKRNMIMNMILMKMNIMKMMMIKFWSSESLIV